MVHVIPGFCFRCSNGVYWGHNNPPIQTLDPNQPNVTERWDGWNKYDRWKQRDIQRHTTLGWLQKNHENGAPLTKFLATKPPGWPQKVVIVTECEPQNGLDFREGKDLY